MTLMDLRRQQNEQLIESGDYDGAIKNYQRTYREQEETIEQFRDLIKQARRVGAKELEQRLLFEIEVRETDLLFIKSNENSVRLMQQITGLEKSGQSEKAKTLRRKIKGQIIEMDGLYLLIVKYQMQRENYQIPQVNTGVDN